MVKIETSKYHVLRIDLSEMDKMTTTAIIFRKRKDQLDLDRTLGEAPLKDVLEQIPRHSCVLLIFAGNQVLSRFSSGEPKNLFEEIDEEEFYFQKQVSDSGWTIQSICRKSNVDPLLDLMLLKNLFVLHMVFDPAVIPEISNLIVDGRVNSGHFGFQFKNGTLEWIIEEHSEESEEPPESGFVLGGMSLSFDGISMLAGLIHYFNEGLAMTPVLLDYQKQNRFYRKYKKLATAILSALFLLLLINFLLYSSVHQNLNQMKSSGENRAEIIGEIDRVQAQIEEYSHLSLNRLDHARGSYSYYLEEIARLRPSGVWFDQLAIDPLIKKPESGKSIETDRTQISLKGETRDPVSLNNFISALKDLPWIRDIELKNYELFREKAIASFEITIRKTNEL